MSVLQKRYFFYLVLLLPTSLSFIFGPPISSTKSKLSVSPINLLRKVSTLYGVRRDKSSKSNNGSDKVSSGTSVKKAENIRSATITESPRPDTLQASSESLSKLTGPVLTMEENMSRVSSCIQKHSKRIVDGLAKNGFAYVDNFLGADMCKVYRSEAEGYYQRGEMVTSQSTRYDSDNNTVVIYDKKNVKSTQLVGGEGYHSAPRLHEYIVTLIKGIVPHINDAFPGAMLSQTMASNKLAVCLGDGSSYDKHYDNSGAGDLRKLTALLYLNPRWRRELGGEFRLFISDEGISRSEEGQLAGVKSSRAAREHFLPGEKSPVYGTDAEGFDHIDIAPVNDRLLVFWSDKIVHSVLPSYIVDNSPEDYRFALTVWLTATDISAILQDDEEVKRHFK